ncbi:MerR family transcriptional regulator [Mumia zhuanghuii]|uniref:MerR family transcriptional regulator n=2 Tax=Mumia TaxID=1546255 RepID=A0ABW1QI42_9ACTN|nr:MULTISPECIES: MerR family transcriptional regulator [Mumia]KAA1418209.1 MerR family transcriptional regulator [Mumia zhuanghuii]
MARDQGLGVYTISVAAELVGTSIQNVRAYDRAGLVEPLRTAGGSRRYSERDIARLRRVVALLDEGLNLAGITMVLALETENAQLRAQIDPDSDGHRS